MRRRIHCKTSDRQDFRVCTARKSYGCWSFLRAQLIQKHLRILEVGGIEAPSEPVVDVGQHCSRFVAALRCGEKPGETCRGAQFPRFGTLPLCKGDCVTKA